MSPILLICALVVMACIFSVAIFVMVMEWIAAGHEERGQR
jgi:hypothetical protein